MARNPDFLPDRYPGYRRRAAPGHRKMVPGRRRQNSALAEFMAGFLQVFGIVLQQNNQLMQMMMMNQHQQNQPHMPPHMMPQMPMLPPPPRPGFSWVEWTTKWRMILAAGPFVGFILFGGLFLLGGDALRKSVPPPPPSSRDFQVGICAGTASDLAMTVQQLLDDEMRLKSQIAALPPVEEIPLRARPDFDRLTRFDFSKGRAEAFRASLKALAERPGDYDQASAARIVGVAQAEVAGAAQRLERAKKQLSFVQSLINR